MNEHRFKAVLLASSEGTMEVLRTLAQLLELDTEETFDSRSNGMLIPSADGSDADFALALEYTMPENPVFRYLPVFYVRMTHICIAEQCPKGTVGVVLSRSSVFSRKGDEDVRGRSLRFFFTEDHGSPREAAAAALAAGIRQIAGFGGISGFVRASGADFTELLPDQESINGAAELLTADIRALTEKNRLAAVRRAVFDSSTQGIVLVDGAGNITDINQLARAYLNCRTKVVTNAYAMNVIPQIDKDVFESAYLLGYSVTNCRIRIGGRQFAVKIEPVMQYDAPVGAALTMTELESPRREREPDRKPGLSASFRFRDFKYLSVGFNYVLKRAKFASYTEEPVLLAGEEGSEMEAFAQSIHNESSREKNVYLQIECSAYDRDYIGEMLFGRAIPTEGDQFTNAVMLAENGTIFLNHVDALPLDLQFRVHELITGIYTPLHDLRRLQADVRVIAAAYRDLLPMVRAGTFREDLYYDLSALTIHIPTLRDRSEDVEDLVRGFVEEYGDKYDKHISLSRGCYGILRQYEWPGNLAEMKNFIKKLVLTAPQRNVNEAYVQSLLADSRRDEAAEAPFSHAEAAGRQGEAAEILAALRRNRGNRQKTADELDISKTTLWRRMQKLGITGDFG